MPGYSEKLDPDLDEEISNGNLSVNGRFLDLGKVLRLKPWKWPERDSL
jgi:hypothetical protein